MMTADLHGKFKTVMVALGLVVCSAFAEEATVKGIAWRYSVVDGTARIDLLNQVYTGKLAIPAKIGKYRVAGVGDGEHPIASVPGPSAIAIPASVTRIGIFAFGGNNNLREVALPAQLTSVPEALFHTCENLSSVKIPASVKSIGVEAFAECRSLKSIVIPEGVKSIDRQAFRDCSGLTSVVIPASVTNIGEMAFARCRKLSKFIVAKGSRTYASHSGALYTKDGKTLVQWLSGSPIAEAVIPDGVTTIVRFAFSDSPKLTSVAIPTSVTSLGELAFANCPNLSVVYTDAGNSERLRAMIAERNQVVADQIIVKEMTRPKNADARSAKTLRK